MKQLDTSSDGYYIVGKSVSLFVSKRDNGGNETWMLEFSFGGNELIRVARQVSDGGFIIAGKAIDGGNTQAFMIKTDAEGKVAASKK